MEITKEFLENLTDKNIEEILKYRELLQEAKEAVSIIKSAYTFHINEKELVLWNDSNNKEILTHSGTWKARYLHQSYDVNIDVNSIFQIYKSEFIDNKNPKTLRNLEAESAKYFRSFVNRTKKRIEESK